MNTKAVSKGTWDVRRHIKVPLLNHPDAAVRVERELGETPGVQSIIANTEKRVLTVQYDASQLDYRSLILRLTRIRMHPLDNWWSRLKGSIFQYSDTNARDNAKAPPPACCNKPPK